MAFQVSDGEVNMGDVVNTKSHGQGKFESWHEGKMNIRCGKELYSLSSEEVSVLPPSKAKPDDEKVLKEIEEDKKKQALEEKAKADAANTEAVKVKQDEINKSQIAEADKRYEDAKKPLLDADAQMKVDADLKKKTDEAGKKAEEDAKKKEEEDKKKEADDKKKEEAANKK